MASVLIKNLTRINFLNIAKSKKARLISIPPNLYIINFFIQEAVPIQTCSIIDPKRTFYTQLEKEWIKKNNIQIKEQMRSKNYFFKMDKKLFQSIKIL